MADFKKLGIDPYILEIIAKQGFTEPTEIQEKAIPFALDGKDLVAGSATGSGKTLVFAMVLSHNIDKRKGVQAVILTPTRELTEQVAKMVRVFAKHLEVVEVIGGVAIGPQMTKLRTANVVVGTPGRVLDHISRGTLKLNSIKVFILDEADRMFDMGFIRDVEKIMAYCPAQKQTMLFSATITGKVFDLAEKYLHDPVEVNAESFVDPNNLLQEYYEVHTGGKFSLLLHLIKSEKRGLVMVFCNTRGTVDLIQGNLAANGVEAHALHGGMPQNKRSKVIADFHSNDVHVLVCTDVAARGLDIKGVEHVYNYNIPKDPIDYVHRIGRTARAGEKGKAISLLTPDEHPNFRGVRRQHRGMKIHRMEHPSIPQIPLKRIKSRGGPRPAGKQAGFRQKPGKPKGYAQKRFNKRRGPSRY